MATNCSRHSITCPMYRDGLARTSAWLTPRSTRSSVPRTALSGTHSSSCTRVQPPDRATARPVTPESTLPAAGPPLATASGAFRVTTTWSGPLGVGSGTEGSAFCSIQALRFTRVQLPRTSPLTKPTLAESRAVTLPSGVCRSCVPFRLTTASKPSRENGPSALVGTQPSNATSTWPPELLPGRTAAPGRRVPSAAPRGALAKRASWVSVSGAWPAAGTTWCTRRASSKAGRTQRRGLDSCAACTPSIVETPESHVKHARPVGPGGADRPGRLGVSRGPRGQRDRTGAHARLARTVGQPAAHAAAGERTRGRSPRGPDGELRGRAPEPRRRPGGAAGPRPHLAEHPLRRLLPTRAPRGTLRDA